MVKNNFENRNFMQSMRRLNMHLGRHTFSLMGFFLGGQWGWGGGGFFFLLPMYFHQVPNGFPKCSPKTFQIAPQFYPILFGHSSTFMHISYKGRNGVPKALPVGDWPIFQKNWPINVTPSKKNPKIAGSPMN